MKSTGASRLVLCEGKDDRIVLETLAGHLGLASRLTFESYDGRDNLRDYLRNLKSRPEFTRGRIRAVLVTRDADQDYQAAWRSVVGAVLDFLSVTLKNPGETAKDSDGRSVVAWVLPGLEQNGMLETMLLEAERERNIELFECLDAFVACHARVKGTSLHEKARFHLWTIAAQNPGAQDRLRIENALQLLPPNWDAPQFRPVVDLLRHFADIVRE